MDLKETDYEDVVWFFFTLGRVQWWAFVDTILNLGFHKRQEFS
jgi:hypothetical protein